MPPRIAAQSGQNAGFPHENDRKYPGAGGSADLPPSHHARRRGSRRQSHPGPVGTGGRRTGSRQQPRSGEQPTLFPALFSIRLPVSHVCNDPSLPRHKRIEIVWALFTCPSFIPFSEPTLLTCLAYKNRTHIHFKKKVSPCPIQG